METQLDSITKLQTRIREIEERINNLRLFDSVYEINIFCDDLVGQVLHTIESAVRHLDKIQTDLVAEINKYRDELLVNATSIKNDCQDDFKLELETLSKELNAFKAQYTNEDLTNDARRDASDLEKRAKDLKRKLRRQIFQGGFMQFNEDTSILSNNQVMGKFGMSHKDPEEMRIEHVVIDDDLSKATSFRVDCNSYKLPDYDYAIRHLMFLRDGNLVIVSGKLPLIIWSVDTNQKLFELEPDGRKSDFTEVIQLQDGRLVSGDREGFIDIWDLDARRQLSTLLPKQRQGKQRQAIRWLRELPSGNFLSYDYWLGMIRPPDFHLFEKRIRHISVWNTSATQAQPMLLSQIPLSGIPVTLELLSNGNLVYTYMDWSHSVYLKMQELNPESGQTFSERILFEFIKEDCPFYRDPTFNFEGKVSQLLPSGDILSFANHGLTEFHSLYENKIYTDVGFHGNMLLCAQLPDGRQRIFYFKDPEWRLEMMGQYMICTFRPNCSCVSKDGKRFVVGCADGDIFVFQIEGH